MRFTTQRLLPAVLLALGLGSLARAEAAVDEASTAPAYEPVKAIPALRGFYDFDVVADDTLILWTDPFHPYLVKLAIGSPGLKFARAIRVQSSTSLVYARFDSVWIRGLRYPIGEIFKMTRDEARRLRSDAEAA
jgi:Family of unknown function (DUF6491)